MITGITEVLITNYAFFEKFQVEDIKKLKILAAFLLILPHIGFAQTCNYGHRLRIQICR